MRAGAFYGLFVVIHDVGHGDGHAPCLDMLAGAGIVNKAGFVMVASLSPTRG